MMMTARVEIRRLDTPQQLFEAAAEHWISVAQNAISHRGRFTIALSGGSTPRSLFTLLAGNASAKLPWSQMYFFWGDERHVPPSDPESNYRMAAESLLSKVPIPPSNVFRIPAENPDASAAAAAYEKTLRDFFAVIPGQFPRFDLILLGMGPDGHTASLFPETAALQEKTHLVVANEVEKLHTTRITLTLPVLNSARSIAFLVSGADKAPALREVLEGSAPPEKYPSKQVRPTDGELVWFLDRAAASDLSAVTMSL